MNSFKPETAIIQVGRQLLRPSHSTDPRAPQEHKADAKVFRNDEHGDVIVTIKDGNADVAVAEGG
ncbi:MAG TPA: hypothetical protein VNA27_01585 [Rubrobacteraceae bacterium]|nr:hypothetical protein [Rubrobacteraceae bacterium]